MICPRCNRPGAGVVNTDDSLDGKEVVRMRACPNCHAKWPTREIDARRLATPIPQTKRKVAVVAMIRKTRLTTSPSYN
jgi:transcriptional regulator NrdR family protein